MIKFRKVSDVLPTRSVGLKRPGVRATVLKLAGLAATMFAALPFLTAPAKASIHHWAATTGLDGSVLQEQTRQPGQYLQLAGHTDVPHHDTNPHGDHTDPWGTHVDVADHNDSAHVDVTSDDSGSES
jgi:hypothetical protein